MIDGSANAMNKCWFSWSCIYIQSSVWDSVSDEDDSRVDHMRFVQLERHICRVLQMIWRHVSLVLKMNQSHQTFSDFCGNICALLWFGWEVCPDTFKFCQWRADYGLILQTAQCLCGWTWNYSDSLLEFHPSFCPAWFCQGSHRVNQINYDEGMHWQLWVKNIYLHYAATVSFIFIYHDYD